MKPDKIEKEWEKAKKQFSPTSLSNVDKNGRPVLIDMLKWMLELLSM